MFKKLMEKQKAHNERCKIKLEERQAKIEEVRISGLNKINNVSSKFEKMQVDNNINTYKSKKEIINEKIEANRAEGIPCCTKCGSIHLTAQKQGFGVGKALVGAVTAGPLGLAAGGINKNKIKLTCLNCGNQFKIK